MRKIFEVKNIICRIVLILTSLLFIHACQESDFVQFENQQHERANYEFSPYRKGVVCLKLNANASVETLSQLNEYEELTSTNRILSFRSDKLGKVLKELKTYRIEHVFTLDPRYKDRYEREGLQFWYNIYFDEKIPSSKAVTKLNSIDDVDFTERLSNVQKNDQHFSTDFSINSPIEDNDSKSNNPRFFNDPYLPKQWAIYNDGSIPGSKKRADLNIVEAWRTGLVGNPSVTVAILDEAVDFSHEDLKGARYEKSYNFYDDEKNGRAIPRPGDHGTHIAGIIAARGNNGIGIAGIAGGNGMADSGVKVMSLQVFYPRKEKPEPKGIPSAFVKAADEGASIANCSWGSDESSLVGFDNSILKGIDYFIKYAGIDANGHQRPQTLMKGGIVVFAAGNSNYEGGAPASYPPVVSVASYGPDYRKSTFSNYGKFVGISAPGGENKYINSTKEIYSTTTNNSYAYMAGTSMAAPMVSGTFALIVSRYGKQGFTNEEAKKIFYSNLRPNEDINELNLTTIYQNKNYNKEYGAYWNKLGAGFPDIGKIAKFTASRVKPSRVSDIRIEEKEGNIIFSWQHVKFSDGQKASSYIISISSKSDSDSKQHSFKFFPEDDLKVGETINYPLAASNLEHRFTVKIETVDRWGAKSEATSKEYEKKNSGDDVEVGKPKLQSLSWSFVDLSWTENQKVDNYTIYYAPYHSLDLVNYKQATYFDSKKGSGAWISHLKENTDYSFVIVGKTKDGSFTHPQFLDVHTKINTPPLLKDSTKNYIVARKGEKTEIRWTDLVYDKDPEDHELKVNYDLPYVNSFSTDKDKQGLKIEPNEYGVFPLQITAYDTGGKSLSREMKIFVPKEKLLGIVYVDSKNKTKNLCVVIGKRANGESHLIVRQSSGQVIYSVNSKNNIFVLDTQKLSPGTYIVRLENGGEVDEESFIIN